MVGSQGSFDIKCMLERGEQVQVRHLEGDLGLKGRSQTTFSGLLEFVYPDSVKFEDKATAKTKVTESVKPKVPEPRMKFSK